MLAGPMDAATRSILAANAAKAAQLEREEYRAIVEANVTRNLLGLSALEIDLKLCAAAHDHAHDMDTLKFFAHESPVPGKTKFTERAAQDGHDGLRGEHRHGLPRRRGRPPGMVSQPAPSDQHADERAQADRGRPIWRPLDGDVRR